MPLESCPICGYALSVHDPHCRHCAISLSGRPSLARFSGAKHLYTMIAAVLGLSVLAYLMFFR